MERSRCARAAPAELGNCQMLAARENIVSTGLAADGSHVRVYAVAINNSGAGVQGMVWNAGSGGYPQIGSAND